ncbi:MAG: methyltransferase, TrmH family [Actinomycetota bacterium]|jgi:TrmH family RNA methyltransferase
MMSPRLSRVGADHPRIKQFINTKRNRPGTPTGALTLEGLWSLRCAVDAGVEIEAVFGCPALFRGDATAQALQDAHACGARLYEVSERVLLRMVDRDGPDGLAAIAHLCRYRLDDLRVGPHTRVVVLDRMELAGNLGAVIRCADGAGASAVIVTERRTRVTHPLVVKASMGTVFSMPVIDATVDDVAAWSRQRGVRVIAAHPAAAVSYRGSHYDGPVALVLGSERYGLSEAWRRAADLLVSIPMHGRADSLNVGHAAALLLYETLGSRDVRRE